MSPPGWCNPGRSAPQSQVTPLHSHMPIVRREATGGVSPTSSQRRLVGFAQIWRDISSFRRGATLHSRMARRSHPEHSKYGKTAGRPGLRPEPRWGRSQRSPRPLSWWGTHPCFRPLGPQPSALRDSNGAAFGPFQ